MRFLVTDCETTNCPTIDGQLEYKSAQAYDLGGIVIDEYGHEYDRFNWVIEDVFFGMPQQMEEAFFANKIPQYLSDMRKGDRQILNIKQAYYSIREFCEKNQVQAIVAHNARFDVTAMNSTVRYLTKSKYRFFFPYGLPILDSIKIARKVLRNNDSYINYCRANHYMTNHKIPQPRYTAEVLWKYFSNNPDFVEAHTGIEDVEIESRIFIKCLEALRLKASRRQT